MNSLTTNVQPKPLSPGQQRALVRLLEDEDPRVMEAVDGRILACGDGALEWLQPHLLERDPSVRRRVRELVNRIGRRRGDERFLTFCLQQGEDLELEAGVWGLALTRYPAINTVAYQALLDGYAADLRERLAEGMSSSAPELLEVINQYLFGELGYAGDDRDYYDPENSYLNRVMDRRLGNPVSLCLIYLFVCRRLRLPVAGIGMPGHFLCRYQSSVEETFIDPFNGGRLLSKGDCIKYLVQASYGYQEGLLAPVTPRRILLRVCSNLHQVYLHRKHKEETNRLQRYVVALAR